MSKESGDFASVMAEANKMAAASISHPFGAPLQNIASLPRAQAGLPVRQETQVFYLPKGAAEYDMLMNRAWAGEITIRYEERNFTKESDIVILVCFFERRTEPRAHEVPSDGDAEPEERSRKLP